MIEYLINLDKEWMIKLNGFHSTAWDSVMILVSERFFWIPLYLLLVFIIIRQFKKASIPILITIGLLIGSTDRISSGLIKPMTQRLRPCHDPSINSNIRVVHGCGGQFGFVSSHAANSFAIALFLYLVAGKKQRWIIFLFPWAGLVAYSRIYLGVHYPGDIICGGILGLLLGYIFYILYKKTVPIIYSKKEEL